MTPDSQQEYRITAEQATQYALLYAESHCPNSASIGAIHKFAQEFEKTLRSRPLAKATEEPRCTRNHHNDDGTLIEYQGSTKPCNICPERRPCFERFYNYRRIVIPAKATELKKGEFCPWQHTDCKDSEDGDNCHCYWPCDRWFAWHDAQIARAATLAEKQKWIDALNTLIATESKRKDKDSVDVIYSYRIAQIIESIRTQEPEK